MSKLAKADLFAAAPKAQLLQETTSTNTLAKEAAAKGAPHGSVFVAQHQTAGRGRLGRVFASPIGGVYISIVLRPTHFAGSTGLLTAGAAVAVCRAVRRQCGKELDIKWVNDLLWRQKKCCGILAEAVWANGLPDYYVLGIGLNYTTPASALGGELASIATSLYPSGNAPVPALELANEIYNQCMAVSHALPDGGVLDEYRRRCVALGQQVTVRAQPPYMALALGVDDEAQLIIQLPSGEKKLLGAGEISICV